MKKNLRERLFGARENRDAEVIAEKKEKTLARINDSESSSAKPRARRTVGLTEERLRAANRQSWMSSTRGWSDLFGRFTWSSKS
jgi:hypothetical protein